MPFDVFRDLGTGVMNPTVDKEFTLERILEIRKTIDLAGIEYIYTSPAQRCIDTSQLIAEQLGTIKKENLIIEPLLSEIKFDLGAIDQQDDVRMALKRGDMRAVNLAVFQSMVSGNHSETVESGYHRVVSLLEQMNSLGTSCLCISHDFFMRVIELRLRRGVLVSKNISTDDLEQTKRNNYLGGFLSDEQFSSFEPIL